MATRRRRQFSKEFKAEAVRLCQVGDRSITRVALDLDLKDGVLRRWIKAAKIKTETTAENPTAALSGTERDELKRLRREVKRLEMEREILKKAAAFFAKENG